MNTMLHILGIVAYTLAIVYYTVALVHLLRSEKRSERKDRIE